MRPSGNDITGTLFNEDGTEYKAPKPVVKNKPSKSAAVTAFVAAPKPKTEFSLFDLVSPQAAECEPNETADEEDESEPDESDEEFDESESVDGNEPEELETVITDNPRKPEQIIPDERNDWEKLTALRQISETQYVDKDGIIYNSAEMTKAATPVITKTARPTASNNTIPDALIKLFGGAIIAR